METPTTPTGLLSSANTVTAASSRLSLSETPASINEKGASFFVLEKPVTMEQSLSNTPTTQVTDYNEPASHSRWLNAPLNPRHLDVIVVLTCFITGLTDSAMFANYSVFTSMQSGNTIFIALGASSQNIHPFVWIRCLFSLFAYSIGTFLFARLHNNLLPPKTRRATLLLTYTFQALFTLVAAAIIQTGAINRYSPQTMASSPRQQWDTLAPICLLSFSAGGQIVAARSLGIMDVPTVVVTTMLCELWADPRLFFKRNAGRDRRLAAFLLMLLGAIIGGWADKASRTVQAALWMAGGLKFGIVGAVAVWSSADIPVSSSGQGKGDV